MKPDGALEFPEPSGRDFSEYSLSLALNIMKVPFTLKRCLIKLTVSDLNFFEAARVSNIINDSGVNIKVGLHINPSYEIDEWTVESLDTYKTVWSEGA